ncbi:MAG: gamma-glutamyl-gamma-aminobutyrate hydrolase family protein [Hungatella sp.]|nr:gamma-glutamyl-gamma-aminobutyrate hydrolase family protein [Hungatella sp.]
MKKPIIGIIPLVDIERESYWMLPAYMKGIEEAGGIPVMLPLSSDAQTLEQLAGALDGFLFTGGHDISPSLYGETPNHCETFCEERDKMEEPLFKLAWAQDKPVLGICRGLQLINAVLGGTLYQDLSIEHPSATCHRQKPPYDVPSHQVSVGEEGPLGRLLGTQKLMVNSCHHQAIKVLAPDLMPMAVSEDGLIEAFYAPKKAFVWAVQWHPEFAFLVDENSRQIFGAFVDSCKTQR